MENKTRQPFDNYKFHLLPTARQIGHKLLGVFSLLPEHTLSSHGDHMGHGAERMLSATLDAHRDDVYHELGHMLINGNPDSQATYKQLQMEFNDERALYT